MHSIDYNPVHDEIAVSVQFAQAIVTFRGDAKGEEAPIRVLQGPSTRMRRPDQVAVDPIHNEMFVAEGDAILVFPRDANGDVAPIRVIEGPDTRLLPKGARATTGSGFSSPPIAVDPVNNIIVLVTGQGLLTFGRTDSGNVKPRTIIEGTPSGSVGGRGVAVYPEGGLILAFVSDPKNRRNVSIGVWHHTDTGAVPPRWRIGTPGGPLQTPRGLTVDPENNAVIASDKMTNAVLTYVVPEIFRKRP